MSERDDGHDKDAFFEELMNEVWARFEEDGRVHEWAGEKDAVEAYEKTSEIPYDYDAEIDLHDFARQNDAMDHLRHELVRLQAEGCETVRVITGAGHGSTSRPDGSQRKAASRFAESLKQDGLVIWVDDSCQYRGTKGAIVVGIRQMKPRALAMDAHTTEET